jgi:hypothetical protein
MMSQSSAIGEVEATQIKQQRPSLRLPDAVSTAEVVLAQAMEYCAQKLGLGGAQEAMERMKEGNTTACSYCHYSVAKQVAEALGALDQNVKAAYVFDYDATPEDQCFGEAVQATPLHLLVWTARKTGALKSMVEALDGALARQLFHLLGRGPRAHMLDVQIIDDADVENRMGYGALLSSLYHRPIKVWER